MNRPPQLAACFILTNANVGLWPFASFRCAAEFGRYRGMADSDKPSVGRFRGSRPSSLKLETIEAPTTVR
jgi:hypothetical protein